MREPPWLLPRTCPGPNRSYSVTSTPRRASCHAVAPPITPPPTTATFMPSCLHAFCLRSEASVTLIAWKALHHPVGEAVGDRLVGVEPPVAPRPATLDLGDAERRPLGEDRQ